MPSLRVTAAVLVMLLLTCHPSVHAIRESTDHLTGNIRLTRNALPSNVARCLSQENINEAQDYQDPSCPGSLNNWSNMHCVNNSFGMFSAANSFMAIGAGPFGVNFLNPFASSEHCKKNQDEIQEKLERHIIENAKLKVNISYKQEMFDKSENEKIQLQSQLRLLRDENILYKTALDSLKAKLGKYTSGLSQCRGETELHVNNADNSLQIANTHIDYLQNQTKELGDINNQLSETLTTQQSALDKCRHVYLSCKNDLSTSETTDNLCQENKNEIQDALDTQLASSDRLVEECRAGYTKIQNELHTSRLSLNTCNAKLTGVHQENKALRQSRDECLDNLSQEENELHLCRDREHHCNQKHNITLGHHEECSEDMKHCQNRSKTIYMTLRRCEADKKMMQKTLIASQAREQHANGMRNELISYLQDSNQTILQLRTSIARLEKNLLDEQNKGVKINRKLDTCQLQLGVANQTNKAMEEKLEDSIEAENAYKIDLNNKKQELARLQSKYEKIYEHLNKIKTNMELHHSEERLCKASLQELNIVQNKCKTKLQELYSLYLVTLEQRDHCNKRHNISTQAGDEWKKQYMQCSNRTSALQLLVQQCKSNLSFSQAVLETLKKGAEKCRNIITDLDAKLLQATQSIHKLTSLQTNLQNNNAELESDVVELTEQLNEKRKAIQELTAFNEDCSSTYNQTLQQLNVLRANVSYSAALIGSLRERFATTSAALSEALFEIGVHQRTYRTTEGLLSKCHNELNATRTLQMMLQQARHDLTEQLRHCRENHTEAQGESARWQDKLNTCRIGIEKVIEQHEQHIKNTLGEITSLKKEVATTETALEEMNVVLAEKNQTISECQEESEMLNQRDMLRITKIRNQQTEITKIHAVYMSFKAQVEICIVKKQNANKELNRVKRKLTNSQADFKRKEERLYIAEQELDQCNRLCLSSNSLQCPAGYGGETYLTIDSGCIMHTHFSASHDKMEKFCTSASGVLAVFGTWNVQQLKDVQEMLEVTGKANSTANLLVWTQQPPNVHGSECFVADLSGLVAKTPYPITYGVKSCGSMLPGVCVSQWHNAPTLAMAMVAKSDQLAEPSQL